MKPLMLDYMYRYIPQPEHWLIKNGIMEIIKSEHYQTQITYYITSCTLYTKAGCWDDGDMFWSQIFLRIRNWLEKILYINIDDKHVRAWQKTINEAIYATSPNKVDSYEVKDCALYWITHYSLLKLEKDKRIKIKL